MFLVFFSLVVSLSLFLFDVLYLWVLLEVIFFFVMAFLIFLSSKKISVSSVVYYLFVQAMSGLILILSFLSEICFYGNFYLMSNSVSVLNFFAGVLGLLIKLGFYPFYIQILVIMSFMNMNQSLVFLIIPKLLPLMLIYDMTQQQHANMALLLLALLLLTVATTQGVLATDIRSFLSWSGMSQLSWMIFAIFTNLFLFLVFFLFYSFLLILFISDVMLMSEKLFMSFSSFGISGIKEGVLFLLLFMMSSLAPFIFFYFKVVVLFSFPLIMFVWFPLILLMTLGVLFLYLRVMQFLLSISFHSGFYSGYNSFFGTNPKTLVVSFLFVFSSSFLLLV